MSWEKTSPPRLKLTSLLAVLVLWVFTGCVPPGGSRPAARGLIGTLRTDGQNVFLNGRQALEGARVFSGDKVVTGAGSSARVEFQRGGFTQLDENTDPHFLQEGLCILIKIVTGQIFVDSMNTCIRVEDPNLQTVLNSRVNWQTLRSRSVVTVLQGRVDVVSPQRISVGAAQQVVAVRGQISSSQTLSPQELDRVSSWLQGYFKTRGRPRPVSVPSLIGMAEKDAVEVLGRSGFKVGRVDRKLTGKARPGTVIDQRPSPRTVASPGVAVDLVIEVPGVKVPSVIGVDEKKAISILDRVGLRTGKVEHSCTGRGQVGTVIDQSPRPEVLVPPNAAINLVVRTLC